MTSAEEARLRRFAHDKRWGVKQWLCLLMYGHEFQIFVQEQTSLHLKCRKCQKVKGFWLYL